MFDIVKAILELICGLALFLYGMDVMGDALKKSAGNKLKQILEKMTSNPIKGFLLGLVVTVIIQSSSATTVMVVGFVNSGTMTLVQSVGVIIGANVGTAITAWLTAPAAMAGAAGEVVTETFVITDLFKTDVWMPILALIGIVLIMFAKRGKKKDLGVILLGFSVLMVGMELMSGSVSGFKDEMKPFFEMFGEGNPIFGPILGVCVGVLVTVIVQSSSASVGILQACVAGGTISIFGAIPIVMGQNIGTCITAILSSISANRNGKRAAMVHLYFNVISVAICLIAFYALSPIDAITEFLSASANAWTIAIIHTVFKIVAVVLLFPFYKQLAKLSIATVKDKKEGEEATNLLDERLFETPSIAVGRAGQVANSMASLSFSALKKSLLVYDSYDAKSADEVRDLEEKVDKHEDALGSYLVKLSACDKSMQDSEQITKLLHLIGDFERISDHAVNIVESAEEMKDKKIEFSDEAKREISVIKAALTNILDITYQALINNDVKLASEVEALEEVIDNLREKIKLNHVIRLQKSECCIEHGFILSDILNNFERVSDHCSNIAGCVVEISEHDALEMHKYLDGIKHGSPEFAAKYNEYKSKYFI